MDKNKAFGILFEAIVQIMLRIIWRKDTFYYITRIIFFIKGSIIYRAQSVSRKSRKYEDNT
jgi:hypothetical protein